LIYLDTSVALAYLLAEDRAPPDRLWQEPLIYDDRLINGARALRFPLYKL
jgi:hypothetical protein